MATTSEPGVLPPRLLRRWGLDVPGEYPRLEPLADEPDGLDQPDGTDGCSWRLTTAATVHRFLLKEYTGGRRRQVLFRHRVTEALADQGLPVPTAIPTGDGRSLVTAAGRRFALYPWIDGQRRGGLDLSLTQCHELGELLGRVHAALDLLTPPVQQTLLVPTSRAARAIVEIDALLAAPGLGGGAAGRGDDFAELAVRRLRERRALLVELADHQPPELDTATVGYVHGDFHAGSLLYGRTRRVTAIVGWGRLAIGPYGGELVRAAVRLFGHHDERGLDLDRVEAFFAGHAAAFPLDGGQIQSAAHRLWWELLCDVGALRRRYLDHETPPADASRSPSLSSRSSLSSPSLVAWWTEHLDRTLDAFAAPYAAASAASPS